LKIAEHGFKRETVSACRGRCEAVDPELRFSAAAAARHLVWNTNTARTVEPRLDRFTVEPEIDVADLSGKSSRSLAREPL
jgi:hypothetical protein